jgi:uncharacterized protein (TIGR02266 family)
VSKNQPSERRWSVRRPINSEFAELEVAIPEYVINLSRTGCFIRSTDPLPIGTQVALKFTVILDDPEILEGLGEVVRVEPVGSTETPGMGVTFLELSPESREIIERLLVRR